MRAEYVNEQAYDILRLVVENKRLLELTKTELNESFERKNPDLTKNIKKLRDAIDKTKLQHKKCKEIYYNDAITVERFKEENLRLVQEEKEAKKELSTADEQLYQSNQFKLEMDKVFDMLDNFDYVYGNLKPEDRKILYRNVFQNIVIEEGRFKRKKSIERFSLYEPFNIVYKAKLEEIRLENQCENKSSTFVPMAAR